MYEKHRPAVIEALAKADDWTYSLNTLCDATGIRSAPVAVLTTRMMNEGLLEDRWEKKKEHPRRFYALTAEGRKAAAKVMP